MSMQFGPAVFVADNVPSQITGMPTGTRIEVHLKNKQVMKGTRGEVSASGFTLVNPPAGDLQLAFADVTSVKQVKKNHTTRNILIIGGVAVVAVAVALTIYIKRCPIGCGSAF
jgi:hypothetical protein